MGLLEALDGPPQGFTLDRVSYRLEPGCWGSLATMYGDWTSRVLLEMLDDASHDQLLDALDDGRTDLADLGKISVALAEAATGRIWWVASHLYGALTGAMWSEINGRLILAGQSAVELARYRPADLCDAVYALLIEGADKKGRDQLDQRLRTPPPGAASSAPLWSAEEEGSAFLAAMAQRPGRGVRAG